MTDLPDVPTAAPGNRLHLDTAPRAVMAGMMNEQVDEIQVMGLVEAADGMRVVLGAALRQAGSYDARLIRKPPMPMMACVLDPSQAIETAVKVAVLGVEAVRARGVEALHVDIGGVKLDDVIAFWNILGRTIETAVAAEAANQGKPS